MTLYQRSSQLWSLLVCAARERKSYTYGELAQILGFERAGTMGSFLGPIMWLCKAKGWPPLTVLVVNQDTGLPGQGLSTVEEVNTDREAVYRFKWFEMEPPQIEDFKSAEQTSK